MKTWKEIKKIMENWMSATAFAESNEPEKALNLAGLEPQWDKRLSIETLTTAIAFAEAGEHDMAREYLGVPPSPRRARILDIPGVKVWIGTVSLEMEPLAIPGVKVWCGTVQANGY